MRPDELHRREDEIDLRLLFTHLKTKWYYFFISILFFSAVSVLYILYKPPVYEAKTSVLIKESRNGSDNIQDILSGDPFGITKNIATEIGIINSRSILEETFNELDLGTGYFLKTGIFSYPLYKTTPFKVEVIRVTDAVHDENFCVAILDSLRFRIQIKSDNQFINDYEYKNIHVYGEEIRSPYFTIKITKNDIGGQKNEGNYYFVLNSMNALYTYYSENLKIIPLNKDATIVQITIQDKITERAIDFLNTLVKVYISRDVKDKSAVASLTLKFIDEQLGEISKTLNKTELDLQKFKEEKGTIDLSEESKSYLERVTTVDENRIKAEIDLRSLDYLYDYVSGDKEIETLTPSSIGNPDPILIGLITKLKELQSKRKSLLYGSSLQSPAIKVIDEQIEFTKKSLIENVNSIRNLTRTNLQSIRNQLGEFEKSIRQIPNIEREFLGIRRNFTVNENIYLYLLQKKAETGIAKATAVSDNKILDEAFLKDIPVVPNRKAVFVISLVLAFIIPLVIIVLQGYLKDTISSREDVEKLTGIPILGVIGHHNNSDRLVVSAKPKSSIAEAFRSIRANLMFFGLSDRNKIVLVTSSVGGEGKSFSAINLATVLSLQHHKVIIIGMDLRKPQLVQDLEVENNDGISTLLIGKTTLDKVIQKTKIEGLDIIPSGPVPPNPSELLSKKEVTELLDSLRNKYDYIIIDTPPVGIVSDAMTLMKYADVNIFILRENYSKKVYIKTINDNYAQGNIKNICILLNDSGSNNKHGYGHGYYDDDSEKSGFLSGIFKKS